MLITPVCLFTTNVSVALAALWVSLPSNLAVTVYVIALTLSILFVWIALIVMITSPLYTPFTVELNTASFPITKSGAIISTLESFLLTVNTFVNVFGLCVSLPVNVTTTV